MTQKSRLGPKNPDSTQFFLNDPIRIDIRFDPLKKIRPEQIQFEPKQLRLDQK